MLLEWSETARGWRLVALHLARVVRVRLPGERAEREVSLAEVRATGPELDLDGVERDRGWVARKACVRGCEHAMRHEVLRRAAGLESRLRGPDHDAHLTAVVA